jgi:hypothetical protein
MGSLSDKGSVNDRKERGASLVSYDIARSAKDAIVFAPDKQLGVSVSIVGGKFGLMELVWRRLPIFR